MCSGSELEVSRGCCPRAGGERWVQRGPLSLVLCAGVWEGTFLVGRFLSRRRFGRAVEFVGGGVQGA